MKLTLVKLTQYHPSIRRLQEDFAARVAEKAHTETNEPQMVRNSLESTCEITRPKPDSFAECWRISCENREKELQEQAKLKSCQGSSNAS